MSEQISDDSSVSIEVEIDSYRAAFKRLRLRVGTRHSHLSRDTGVSRSTIKTVEDGDTHWTVPTLLRLLNGIGATLSDLEAEMRQGPESVEPEPIATEPEPDSPMKDFFSFEDPAVREGARRLLGLMIPVGGTPNPDVQRIADQIDRIDARVASLEAVDPEDKKPNGTNGDH